MKNRALVGGVVATLVAIVGAAWVAGSGPFATSPGASLSEEEQAIIEDVEAATLPGEPAGAARYVDANLDALLSADIAGAVDEAALVGLFDAALGDQGGGPDLFAQVVAAVAEEGETYSDGLRQVFAEAAAAHMAWFDTRVNEPFAYGPGELPDELRQGYLDAHDFLRETMRDPDAAERLRRAVDEYGTAETAGAPDSGETRALRLAELGRVQAFFAEAHRNAETGEAMDDDAFQAAQAADRERRTEDAIDHAVWVALDLYESDPAVRESARGEPFVDGDGAIRANLSGPDADALDEWAVALAAEGGPTARDVNTIDGGAADISLPLHGVLVEDRR